MTPFGIAGPGRILFGRGEAAKAGGLIRSFGDRVLVVHGANPDRIAWLSVPGARLEPLACPGEPTLPMLEQALMRAREFAPLVVVGVGGGAVLDMAKALAALIPATGEPMDHLEVVGKALPLTVPPLPFIAIPTTSGTGAEATKNAVIGVPDHHRKVSLRDDRMLARIAIVDPALTDHCPRRVTLASGLDALTQVIEPYVCAKATPYTDALTRPAIALGAGALIRLMHGEDAQARDDLAWVSLCGGLALANSGLGAVHGLAGVIGGIIPAAHGAICGALLGPVLQMNRARATGEALDRLTQVCGILARALNTTAEDAPRALQEWSAAGGLPRLTAQGLHADVHQSVAAAALVSSSMKANPVALTVDDLRAVLECA